MSLADKLSAMRAASAGRIPADKQAIMHRATEDLRRSGILDHIVPVGGRMPPFDTTTIRTLCRVATVSASPFTGQASASI